MQLELRSGAFASSHAELRSRGAACPVRDSTVTHLAASSLYVTGVTSLEEQRLLQPHLVGQFPDKAITWTRSFPILYLATH
jgi:hypothetical protein